MVTLESGRDGAWNLGRPPRARLVPAALLCARVAATARKRRVRAGAPRRRTENEAEKEDKEGIAAAPELKTRSWYHPAADGRANAAGAASG